MSTKPETQDERALRPEEENGARRREQARIRRACEGDGGACREIVEQHRRGMYAIALRMIGDKAEAEDLVQDSFARAFRRLSQFDTTYRLSTWLYRIVLNSCRDHLKSPRRNERPSSARQLELAESDPWLARERKQRLSSAIGKLTPHYSEIVMLKDVMELSYEEIHALTGTPVTGLKIRAIRARDRLRELLEEETP